MSKDYNHEVGYETLRTEWELQKKRTPRGVTLVKGGSNIYLQFKTSNKSRSKYNCNCVFSIDGMHEAVRKSHLVKGKLKSLDNEVEFWNWYKEEIEEAERLIDNRLTIGDAIAKVEADFWDRPDRRRRQRDKNNPSDASSWNDTYGRFYKHLPLNETISFQSIKKTTDKWRKGTKTYKGVVSAMKKLAIISHRNRRCAESRPSKRYIR